MRGWLWGPNRGRELRALHFPACRWMTGREAGSACLNVFRLVVLGLNDTGIPVHIPPTPAITCSSGRRRRTMRRRSTASPRPSGGATRTPSRPLQTLPIFFGGRGSERSAGSSTSARAWASHLCCRGRWHTTGHLQGHHTQSAGRHQHRATTVPAGAHVVGPQSTQARSPGYKKEVCVRSCTSARVI